jgi:hypothetical protein
MHSTAIAIRCSLLVLLGLCSGSIAAENLAITFDDLPLNGMLQAGTNEVDLVNRTLAILAAKQVPAVYGFVNARKLESNPAGARALQRWVDAQQRVGNHGYSHLDLNTHSVEDYGRDILRNEPVLALTWSGPTARLLSDGLRKAAAPCGPSNPTPSPSKLATSVAPGREPCDLCSTSAAPGGLFITGGVAVAAGFCRIVGNSGD